MDITAFPIHFRIKIFFPTFTLITRTAPGAGTMTFIPNIPIPFPDEITYSYMTRTAEANCLSLKAFYKAFVSYDKPLRYFDSDIFFT